MFPRRTLQTQQQQNTLELGGGGWQNAVTKT